MNPYHHISKSVFVAVALLAIPTLAQAQYIFGSEVQSNPSASITYTSGTFDYTNPNTDGGTDDDAYLPLAGTAAGFITTTNNWSVSVTANLTARSMTSTGSQTPDVGLGIGLLGSNGSNNYLADIALLQENNTGSNGNTDYQNYTYGTLAGFHDETNGTYQTTTALGSSVSYDGNSNLILTSGTSSTAATESISAASGTLTLSFDASTGLLTGSYNGINVGSFSLTNWGSNPSLTLGVFGSSGEGIAVTTGTDTGSSFSATPEPSTWALLLGGLGLLAFWRVRRVQV